MKKLTFTLLAAAVAFFIIQGCNKDTLPAVGGKLKASKTEIKAGQLDTLLFTGANTTDSLTWTVSPNGKDILRIRGNAATIVFNAAGTYVVTAQKTGGQPASITINVSAGTPVVSKADSSSDVVTTSTVDTLQIVPITTDIIMSGFSGRNATGDSVSLYLMPLTEMTNKYCIRAILQYKAVFTADNHINIDFFNIRESKGCQIETTAGVKTGIINGTLIWKNHPLGTYPLTITVGSVVYTGSVVIGANNVTFNWPYTSGVIFPQKVL